MYFRESENVAIEMTLNQGRLVHIYIRIYLYHLMMASTPLAMSFCADVYEYEYIFLQLLVRKNYIKT